MLKLEVMVRRRTCLLSLELARNGFGDGGSLIEMSIDQTTLFATFPAAFDTLTAAASFPAEIQTTSASDVDNGL